MSPLEEAPLPKFCRLPSFSSNILITLWSQQQQWREPLKMLEAEPPRGQNFGQIMGAKSESIDICVSYTFFTILRVFWSPWISGVLLLGCLPELLFAAHANWRRSSSPRTLKSVLVLPAQILGPFGPPKNRVNFDMFQKHKKSALYSDPQTLNQNKVMLPYCALFNK